VTVRVDHAVVGASDLAVSVAFVSALGFEVVDQRELSPEQAGDLYALPGGTTEVVLAAPGAAAGSVRVVATPLPHPAYDPYRRGGHALDLYTTDIERSLALSAEAGAEVGPLADYDFGPIHLRQAQATGPDGVPWVFVEIAHRLPSLLDAEPERLHSELHSAVWAVDDLDATTAWWTDVVGLDLRSRFPITEPAVPAFMGLPRPTTLAMSVLTGPAAAAPRFELLAYDDEPGVHVPVVPLVAGGTIPVLESADLGAALDRIRAGGGVPRTPVRAPGIDGSAQLACVIAGPDGLGLELRQARSSA
jgi:catechol 2,3-dioxygenase-like lactoylglutathione lyase family enzyme